MKNDKLYLEHIGECISKVEEYVKDGKQVFLNDEKTSDAVLRRLQILAESTQRLSDQIKIDSDEIQWKEMAGFRNILTHVYLDINLNRIWNTIENDLPKLKVFIEKKLKEFS